MYKQSYILSTIVSLFITEYTYEIDHNVVNSHKCAEYSLTIKEVHILGFNICVSVRVCVHGLSQARSWKLAQTNDYNENVE